MTTKHHNSQNVEASELILGPTDGISTPSGGYDDSWELMGKTIIDRNRFGWGPPKQSKFGWSCYLGVTVLLAIQMYVWTFPLYDQMEGYNTPTVLHVTNTTNVTAPEWTYSAPYVKPEDRIFSPAAFWCIAVGLPFGGFALYTSVFLAAGGRYGTDLWVHDDAISFLKGFCILFVFCYWLASYLASRISLPGHTFYDICDYDLGTQECQKNDAETLQKALSSFPNAEICFICATLFFFSLYQCNKVLMFINAYFVKIYDLSFASVASASMSNMAKMIEHVHNISHVDTDLARISKQLARSTSSPSKSNNNSNNNVSASASGTNLKTGGGGVVPDLVLSEQQTELSQLPFDRHILLSLHSMVLIFVGFAPLYLAIFVSITLVHDNVVQREEFLGSIVLGMIVAWFTYCMFWISPFDTMEPGGSMQLSGIPINSFYYEDMESKMLQAQRAILGGIASGLDDLQLVTPTSAMNANASMQPNNDTLAFGDDDMKYRAENKNFRSNESLRSKSFTNTNMFPSDAPTAAGATGAEANKSPSIKYAKQGQSPTSLEMNENEASALRGLRGLSGLRDASAWYSNSKISTGSYDSKANESLIWKNDDSIVGSTRVHAGQQVKHATQVGMDQSDEKVQATLTLVGNRYERYVWSRGEEINSKDDNVQYMTRGNKAIGKFVVDDVNGSNGVVGTGTFGQVYRCYDWGVRTGARVPVAIKLMKCHITGAGAGAGARARQGNDWKGLKELDTKKMDWLAWNEVACLKRVSHENVIQLLAYDMNGKFENQSVNLFVLEYAPNGDLRQLMRRIAPVQDVLARTYFKQIMAGLNACHSAGVIHRDLKLDNIVLDANYNAKICDFGLSKVVLKRPFCVKPHFVGTTGFAAPEVMRMGEYDETCDVFSLGVILFIMLTAKQPFKCVVIRNSSLSQTQGQVDKMRFKYEKAYQMFVSNNNAFWSTYIQPDVAKEVSDNVKSLMLKMMSDDKSHRIRPDNVLEHSWCTKNVLKSAHLFQEITRSMQSPSVDLAAMINSANLDQTKSTALVAGTVGDHENTVSNPLVVMLGIGKYDGSHDLTGVSKDYQNMLHTFNQVFGYSMIYKTGGADTGGKDNVVVLESKDSKPAQDGQDCDKFKLSWEIPEIEEFVKQVRKKVEHGNFDSLIFIISSHGSLLSSDLASGVIYDSKFDPYELSKILKKFDERKCRNLANKPKIFILDACRGQVQQQASHTMQSIQVQTLDMTQKKSRSETSGTSASASTDMVYSDAAATRVERERGASPSHTEIVLDTNKKLSSRASSGSSGSPQPSAQQIAQIAAKAGVGVGAAATETKPNLVLNISVGSAHGNDHDLSHMTDFKLVYSQPEKNGVVSVDGGEAGGYLIQATHKMFGKLVQRAGSGQAGNAKEVVSFDLNDVVKEMKEYIGQVDFGYGQKINVAENICSLTVRLQQKQSSN